MAEPTGVLLMAYGTPRALDQVEAYYTHIRGGRPPNPDRLADLVHRYTAIGGISPLRAITEAQAAGLQAALDRQATGGYRVVLGLKHAPPFIEDAVAQLRGEGVRRAVALVLAPHYAHRSVGEYLQRARAAAGDRLTLVAVTSWHLHPGYLDLLADAVREALTHIPADRRRATQVLFTAHSLPAAQVAAGDDYAGRVRETAAAVAGRLKLRDWDVAWQSAGATEETWLGPDVVEVIRSLPEQGVAGVVVCACGFVADHLEVLYDLDIEARQAAEEVGVAFARTPMPNADPRLSATLAALVLAPGPAPAGA